MGSTDANCAFFDEEVSLDELLSLLRREDGGDDVLEHNRRYREIVDKLSKWEEEIKKDLSSGRQPAESPNPKEPNLALQNRIQRPEEKSERSALCNKQYLSLLHSYICQRSPGEVLRPRPNDDRCNLSLTSRTCPSLRKMLVHLAICKTPSKCRDPHCRFKEVEHVKDRLRRKAIGLAEEELEMNRGSVVNDDSDSGKVEDSPSLVGLVRITAVESSKLWHQSIEANLRKEILKKIVATIIRNPPCQAVLDPKSHNLFPSARQIEVSAFAEADSKSQYFLLVIQKVFKVLKEQEKNRQKQATQVPKAPAVTANPILADELTATVSVVRL